MTEPKLASGPWTLVLKPTLDFFMTRNWSSALSSFLASIYLLVGFALKNFGLLKFNAFSFCIGLKSLSNSNNSHKFLWLLLYWSPNQFQIALLLHILVIELHQKSKSSQNCFKTINIILHRDFTLGPISREVKAIKETWVLKRNVFKQNTLKNVDA